MFSNNMLLRRQIGDADVIVSEPQASTEANIFMPDKEEVKIGLNVTEKNSGRSQCKKPLNL